LWRKFIDLFVGGSQRKYLNHLRTICDDLKKNYFPVDQVSSQLKAGKFIPESSYDVANLQKQTKPWLYDVADRFKKLTNVAGFTQMLSFNLSDRLPNGKFLTGDQFNELVQCAHEVNEYYDQDVKSGIDPQQAMLVGMKIIFKQAYQLTGALSYETIRDRLVATQILTDFAMKSLTAAGLKGNPFAEYASGYALNNPDEMITEIEADIAQEGFDKETVLETFDDALMEWGPDDSRFNVVIGELGGEKESQLSPMNQPKQHADPVVSSIL
jgi:hypothetical protein